MMTVGWLYIPVSVLKFIELNTLSGWIARYVNYITIKLLKTIVSKIKQIRKRELERETGEREQRGGYSMLVNKSLTLGGGRYRKM